jgi:hypothetical protein
MKRVLLLIGSAAVAFAQPALIKQAECFAFEKIENPETKKTANAILMEALDSEALFTIASGMKPVSLGFWYAFGTSESRVAEWKSALPLLNCGEDLEWWIAPVGPTYRGKRFVHLQVARRSAVLRVMSEHPEFFGRLKIDQTMSTARILSMIDNARSEDVFRGFGLLLGSPEAAVRYGETQRALQSEGLRLPQGSLTLPTGGGRPFAWSWQRPIGAESSPWEKQREERAKAILEEYKKRKRASANELLREWFCKESACRLPD